MSDGERLLVSLLIVFGGIGFLWAMYSIVKRLPNRSVYVLGVLCLIIVVYLSL